jgi:hypothetical protein
MNGAEELPIWVRLITGTPRTLRGTRSDFSSFYRIKIV